MHSRPLNWCAVKFVDAAAAALQRNVCPGCAAAWRYRSACTAVGAAVFHGTHTAPGPVPPTGKTVASDDAYVMQMEGGKVRHMTKIWNDGAAVRALGWA